LLYFAMLIAAAVGGVSRFLLSNLLAAHWSGSSPLPTLIVNLSGAMLLGVLWAGKNAQQLTESYWQVLALAALGSFTTVSSLSLQTVTLWQNARYLQATLYIVLTLVGGLSLLITGSCLGQQLW
jgi:CrcB protein